MDKYLITNIQASVASKDGTRRFDIVEAVSIDIFESGGGRGITWFVDAGYGTKMFAPGIGVYEVRVAATGNGSRPTQAKWVGMPTWPGEDVLASSAS